MSLETKKPAWKNTVLHCETKEFEALVRQLGMERQALDELMQETVIDKNDNP